MSKIIDQQLEKTLISLGLNNKEIQIYIELLQSGEMSAITLSKNLELHRQFIYNALLTLRDKDLVLQIGTKRSKWRAQNPRKLISLAEEREKKALEASEVLLAMMHQKAGQEFVITEGTKAFRNRILQKIRQTPKNSTILMICGEWDRYFDLVGQFAHAEWDRIRISRGINFRIIGPESLEKTMRSSSSERGLMEYRTMTGLKQNLVNTIISEDTIDFDIYSDPHLTFSIKNPEVAQSQRTFFETLWLANSKK
ncbi:MAG: helix-turn-helix domain-containing protein [Candidatus Moraniibacteriota bacterium]